MIFGMSERAEQKSENAHRFEAAEFYRGAGGQRMSAGDRIVYEEMESRLAEAVERHQAARDEDEI